MSIFGSGLASRLHAALRAFRRPDLVGKRLSWQYPLDQSVVLENGLLAGKNVLITGAGRNIGKSIALEMAHQGATVFCTCLDPGLCRDLEREVSQLYPAKVQWLHSDVTSRVDNDALMAHFRSQRIRIDAFVNNTISDSRDMVESYQANLFGPVYLARQIARTMIGARTPGSILFMSSIHQERIRRNMSYSSSKAAIKMVIEELAVELGPYNIRVNGIAPGYVGEDALGEALPHRHTPLAGSSINPRYIGRAAVYLTCDYFSRFTTGTVLRIDAGLSLYNHLCLDVSSRQ